VDPNEDDPRLRFAGVRTSARRVRRVMRENGLLAPHRVGRTDNIIPQAPELKNMSTSSMLYVFGL
jgi:hypothetical protein